MAVVIYTGGGFLVAECKYNMGATYVIDVCRCSITSRPNLQDGGTMRVYDGPAPNRRVARRVTVQVMSHALLARRWDSFYTSYMSIS